MRYSSTAASDYDSMNVRRSDRQYSPFIFNFQGQKIVPTESVYAVFEAKQTINATLVKYAQEKVATVRSQHRTSLPIPSANDTAPAEKPAHILGGILHSRVTGARRSASRF